MIIEFQFKYSDDVSLLNHLYLNIFIKDITDSKRYVAHLNRFRQFYKDE